MVEDEKCSVNIEEVLTIKAAPTTEPEGSVLDEFGTDFLKRALVKYCVVFDVPFQEMLDETKIGGIPIQVRVRPTETSYANLIGSQVALAQSTILSRSFM